MTLTFLTLAQAAAVLLPPLVVAGWIWRAK